jgi:hypothetical protein
LGVEKGGVDCAAGADLVDVVRDQALEKLARIGAADGEHAATVKKDEGFLTEGNHFKQL